MGTPFLNQKTLPQKAYRATVKYIEYFATLVMICRKIKRDD
jgi:hypothetical protein